MKIERQSKILQLISENVIETQEELANKLLESGFMVTQATVSRDIRDLKLTKIPIENGRQKYIALADKDHQLNEKYIRVFREGFYSMDRAGNIVVIRTETGMAMAVAAAIDAMNFENVVGCIAGDDTIFCAVRTQEQTIQVMERFSKIVNSGE